MARLLLVAASTICCVFPLARQAWAGDAVDHVDRAIGKEPKYQSKPKYCLMVFGNDGSAKVWMVEDGRRLFVDKNANGDLTDDGPPLRPGKIRRSGAEQSFEYQLDAITPADGTKHSDFVLWRRDDGEEEDNYGLSLSVGGQLPMYAGWFGTFWSEGRERAPVIYFGGPFTPKVQRREAFTLGETGRRLSVCFVHPGSDQGAVSRLSIEALPRSVTPELTIEWPAADGGEPIRTSHALAQRCCYWEFYTTDFEVPDGVAEGEAKISVNLPLRGTPIELTTTEIAVPVVASKNSLIDTLNVLRRAVAR